ncbi:MAG: hypothetical protein R3F61_07700 [Myxococcota bacterium]
MIRNAVPLLLVTGGCSSTISFEITNRTDLRVGVEVAEVERSRATIPPGDQRRVVIGYEPGARHTLVVLDDGAEIQRIPCPDLPVAIDSRVHHTLVVRVHPDPAESTCTLPAF